MQVRPTLSRPPEDDNGKPRSRLEFNTSIKSEDTYFLIYGRLDRQETQRRKELGEKIELKSGELLSMLDIEINLIFTDGDDDTYYKDIDPENYIDYQTYLRRVNKHALKKRQDNKEKKSKLDKNNN